MSTAHKQSSTAVMLQPPNGAVPTQVGITTLNE